MQIEELIRAARDLNSSDIHISKGLPLMFRIHGKLVRQEVSLSEDETLELIYGLMDDDGKSRYERGLDVDFAFTVSDGSRQRVNVFRQKGNIAATIRLLNTAIPSLLELKLPMILQELISEQRGLILVTGPTGSGKSTTLASMIDLINQREHMHIITIEDPIEYVYTMKKSLIHQREVERDTISFADALRSALREDPDVILVGEMRDFETISAALTAAETGHLVLSTLHTTGAPETIDRIIDACPGEIQNQIRSQLSTVLKGVITQSLMPSADQMGRVAATEVMIGTDAIGNMIRENKIHQIGSSMQSGGNLGMHTLNMDLMRLIDSGQITKETAMKYTNDRRDLSQYLHV